MDMNGACDCEPSEGQESLDASPENFLKQESSSVSAVSGISDEPVGGIDPKAISGVDVALSEDCIDLDKQSTNSRSSGSVTESCRLQSELGVTRDQDQLLTSDLDSLPNGGFDDMVAMEAEGDSQFEQTMAMLRDLSSSDVCPAMVFCVDDAPCDGEQDEKLDTELNSNLSQTSSVNCGKDEDSSGNKLSTAEHVDTVQCKQYSSLIPERKQKSSSGFFNRCIENLLQRGRETVRCVSPGQTAPPNKQEEHQSHDCAVSDTTVTTGSSVKIATSSRSHRKSRKPTKLSYMRLSEDVVIPTAKLTLSFRCEKCTYTCNTSSELSAHSSVCSVDSHPHTKHSGFTCRSCKTRSNSIDDFKVHMSQHLGNHVFRCFSCHYCDHCSDSLDDMDEHVSNNHPSEVQKYEVSLEKVTYLQNMLECPVCSGAFIWKLEFVKHCRAGHQLEDLAVYLEENFSDTSVPDHCKVSRQLFESYADILQSDASKDNTLPADVRTSDLETEHLSAGAARHFQCDQCSFTADSWEAWDRHMQQYHEQANSDYIQTAENWSDGGPLVIDEDSNAPDGPANDTPSQNVFPTSSSCSGENLRSQLESDKSLECSSTSFSETWKKEGTDELFPPGMEPELIAVNPGSGDVPNLMRIGSGRKGVKLRCRLCPFECYRTPNFRRHLAIHIHQAEYSESYRCSYCKFQHRRLNCIRFHLGKYHSHLPAKLSRVVGGKVTEVINADDVNLHSNANSSYAQRMPVPSKQFITNVSAPYVTNTLPAVSTDQFDTTKKDPMSTVSSHDASLDDSSQTGNALSREKRLCKPPKRLSETTDFQPPGVTGWRIRRASATGLEGGTGNPFSSLAALSQRGTAGRPFDDNIAEDYIQSDLPPGMIYPEPIKCPRCSFTNRVRINLVRHMKQHHAEDLQRHRGRSFTSDAAVPTSEPNWMEKVPAWARPQSSEHSSTISHTHSLMKTTGNTSNSNVGGHMMKQPPKLPSRLGMLTGADASFTHGYLASGRLEWNSEIYGNNGRARDSLETSQPPPSGLVTSTKLSSTSGSLSGGRLISKVGAVFPREAPAKRLFKCAYCSVSSRWNRRDISLHVLHVHVRRRAFRCRRCGYGTSKSATAVSVHCARTHPGRPAIIEDNLVVLNAILPLHTRPGIVLVAFRRSNGVPIMNLDELEDYFGLSKLSAESPDEQNQKESSPTFETFHQEEPVQQQPGATPLDLSAQIQKEPSPSLPPLLSSCLPTHEVVSPDTSHVYLQSASSSLKTLSERHSQAQADLSRTGSAVRWNRAELTNTTKSQQRDVGRLNSNPAANFSSNKEPSIIPPGTAFYRCKLCGYQDSRHDKTKYHVVREHLHLGPYGCAYCPRYMWGRRHVARHIAAVHPSMPVQIRRAFDEFETYLRENIRKIGGQQSKFQSPSSQRKAAPSPVGTSRTTTPGHSESAPSVSTLETSVQPGTQQPSEPVKRKPLFQCGHCSYRDALAAKVQGHCLAKHPSKPVRYRRCDEEQMPESSAVGCLAEVKIESVESLAFGQDVFPTPSASRPISSTTSQEVRTPGEPLYGQTSRRSITGLPGSSSSFSAPVTEIRSKLVADNFGGRRTSGVSEFPPYMCRYCPESSWTEDLIRSHLASCHADKPPLFGVVQDSTAPAADNILDPTTDDEDDDVEDEETTKYSGITISESTFIEEMNKAAQKPKRPVKFQYTHVQNNALIHSTRSSAVAEGPHDVYNTFPIELNSQPDAFSLLYFFTPCSNTLSTWP